MGMKNFIGKLLLSFLDTSLIEDKLRKGKHQQKMKGLRTLTPTGIYDETEIHNFSGDPSRISIGKNTHVRGKLQVFAYGGSITIGDHCYVGENSYIWSGDKVLIGNNVLISHQVNIVDSNSHELLASERHKGYLHILQVGHPKEKGSIETAPITIEDDVWISFGTIILKGITIGKGAIVGAGSVVTKDVKPYTMVAGNPAQVIKELPRG